MERQKATGKGAGEQAETRPKPPKRKVAIRIAREDDAAVLSEILNREIRETTATWTDEEKSVEQMLEWMRGRLDQGHPVLVAELAGSEEAPIVGYGSYGGFRSWPGYRHTVEHTVYVRSDMRGGGVGRALIAELERCARKAGMRAIIGGVSAENSESVRLHRRLGYVEVGRLPQVGRKFDRWLTLVLMQKLLLEEPGPATDNASGSPNRGALSRLKDPDYVTWMIRKFFDMFVGRAPEFEPHPERPAQLAAAAVMVEAARSDGDYAPEERQTIDRVLSETFGLSISGAAQLRVEAETAQADSAGSHRFTSAIKNAMSYDERVSFVESLWRVVLADGERHDSEDVLMRKIVGLIYVDDRDSAAARRRALEAMSDTVNEASGSAPKGPKDGGS